MRKKKWTRLEKGGNKMKQKKTVLIFSLILISIVYIVFPYIYSKKDETAFNVNKDMIRFHVIANSDSKNDQKLKLRIRDKILEEMGSEFNESKSIENSREIINKNLNKIKDIAENEIIAEGKDYNVEVVLGNDKFPTKTYGDLTLPAGEYEALKVVIGEGKGQNWWCVMFPPLCFVDITHSVSPMDEEEFKEEINKKEKDDEKEDETNVTNEMEEDEKEIIEERYVKEEIKEDIHDDNENEETEILEEEKIVLKSKVVEVFEKTKTQMARMFIIE